ncbi:MAG: zf-TFIIB domain-containing protein [Cyanobacteria bacterium SID2]|nr:zf-TFIIB domain-containing protein [Cyanobacteria bacterium SID2]MBP0006829.1 zf-TFIIB domain-containing protein [Cyanobacteria bacterium SBC]
MQCPKHKTSTLVEHLLEPGLTAMQCPQTGGVWIDRDRYEAWRSQQAQAELDPVDLSQKLEQIDFQPAPEDTKAALCPESGRILVRARVDTQPPFYVDRSPVNGGIWLDRGEWDILKQLGLHLQIDRLFSGDWQAQLREQQQIERSREATIEKLGADLAQQVFDLAEALKQHPRGDFGVAYLMQQFDRPE